jgi:hypothetical protein
MLVVILQCEADATWMLLQQLQALQGPLPA